MIRYALQCATGHGFEAWFGSSSAFDDQAARGLVECPICGVAQVSKAIMAPAVAGTKRSESDPSPVKMQEVFRRAAREVRRHVMSEFDDVGPRFAEEARAIHEGQAEDRGIYGQATSAEVRALHEDGVAVAQLPSEPPDESKLN